MDTKIIMMYVCQVVFPMLTQTLIYPSTVHEVSSSIIVSPISQMRKSEALKAIGLKVQEDAQCLGLISHLTACEVCN